MSVIEEGEKTTGVSNIPWLSGRCGKTVKKSYCQEKFETESLEGNDNPLWYSCLENPMDGGAWWVAVHVVTKSQTWLSSFTFTFMHWRRKWQPTPVFLPGESQGLGHLVGCCLWCRTESDTTETTQQQQQRGYDYAKTDRLHRETFGQEMGEGGGVWWRVGLNISINCLPAVSSGESYLTSLNQSFLSRINEIT